MGNQKGIGPDGGNKYNPRGGIIVKITAEDTNGTYDCVPGSPVHMPPGVPHKVVSEEGVKMLMVYGPAGTEAMFADMKKLTPEQRADKEFVAEVRARHKTVNIE